MTRSSEAPVVETEALESIDGVVGTDAYIPKHSIALPLPSTIKSILVSTLATLLDRSPRCAMLAGRLVLWCWPGLRER